MKHSLVRATFVATLVGFIAATVQAQQAPVRRPVQPAVAAGPNVAIIDLSYIFKNHNRFKAMTAEMRGTVEAAENSLKDQRDALAARAKSLNEDFKKGTQEYKQLEEELTKTQADLQAQISLKKKEFLEREAAIYYSVYREVLDEVKAYADGRGISLVLRFNGDEIDGTNPQDVIKELNKSVVYYHQSIDITYPVLTILNDRSTPPPANGTVRRPGVPIPQR